MKTRVLLMISQLAAGMLVCMQSSCFSEKNESDNKTEMAESPPLKQIHLNHGNSYLSELRSAGKNIPDFQTEIKAEATVSCQPIKATADVKIDRAPLFWFNPESNTVIVHKDYFFDLTVVRAQYADEGGELVGIFKAVGKIPPIDLVEFLLRADIIQANKHTTAELEVISKKSDSTGFSCEIKCEDTYFTNKKNVDRFVFEVSISNEGEIRVSRV